MRIIRLRAVLVTAMLAWVVTCVGQTSRGRILGTITDQSGAVVAKARVTVTNISTDSVRNLMTTSAGEYVASNLDPGTYSVAVEAQGFKKALSNQILLEVATDVRVDLKLQPGVATETIVVTAEGALTDTTDSTLNGVLSNKAISELPVQGRDFQNLLELHPGVQRTAGGGFHSVTSNGNRPDDNNFFIDGADDNDIYYGETVVNDAGVAGTPASFLPLDSIQEFNTQEGPSADYGVKPGVVMNIGIKSGTNTIHGSAYYFHRNAAFDARNYFNPTGPVAALIMHEFGASLGGPIKKDKWFYFFNYEGIRDKVGNPGVTDSPVQSSLIGRVDPNQFTPENYSIADAVSGPNGCMASATCNALSLSLLSLFLPNPGLTLKQSDPAAINFSFNNKNHGDNFVGKTDFVLNAKNVFSARVIYSNTNQTEEDTIPLRPEWLSTTKPSTQVFGVNLASTPTSAWSNEARFSYNRFNEAIFPVDHNVNPTAYGLNTGVTDPRLFGFPRITPGGEFNYMGGNSGWPLDTTPSQTYSLGDTASYTHGKHTVRFGGTFRFGDVKYYRATYGRGRVDFRHLPDFVAGNVRRWRFLYGDPTRDISQKSFGLFAQDDFHVAPNLTLNLGVRYDVTYPIKDSHNLLANYVPNSASGIVQVGQGLNSPYPTNYNNFSPRIGLAWDVFGKGKTVLRSGFGIIFEQPSIRTFAFSGGGLSLNPSGIPYASDPNSGNLTQPQGTIKSFLKISTDGSLINWSSPNQALPIFPGTAGNFCDVPNDQVLTGGGQCDLFGVDLHLKTPYVMNWNFDIQQELSRSMLLQVAYVANHGVKLYSVTDINQINPVPDGGSLSYGRPLNTSCPVSQGGLGLGGGPCHPQIGFLSYLSNRSNSNYNSLQVTLTKRYSKGLYLLAGYTYGHAIDTATSNLAGVPPDSNNYSAERGNGDYDIRHRFTLSATYDLPSVKSKWQMLEGWQVTSILNLQGGQPFTLGDFNDGISGNGEFNDRWNIHGPASNIHWSPTTPIPYFSSGDPACAPYADPGQLAVFGCYVAGSTVITPPNNFAQGTMGRNIFRGPTFKNLDFSLSKAWKLSERVKLQFRGEVFNILNHTNFDVFTMNTDLSSPTAVGTVVFTPDVASSNPVIGSGGSRHIQLGAKIIW